MDDHEEGRGGLDDLGLPEHGGSHRRRWRGCGCIAALVVLAVVVAGFYVALTRGVDWVSDQFAEPEDYAGPGTGRVVVEVHQGDNATDIGRMLKEKSVVASVGAFINAANARADESAGIQVGFYELQRKMKADDALSILVDPANLVRNMVTVPEGLRVVDTVALLADKTDFTRKQYNRVLQDAKGLGLPDYAGGNAEGYLFPATYDIGPKATPRSVLKLMVDRWHEAAEDAGLEQAAQRLGYTPAELMTIASLVEAEGRGDDMPKIARVIYNRLETEGEPTYGKLEIDATVNYALGRKLGVALSEEDLAVDSPYNTRKNPGLPPGPIEAPGDDAIAAAANPAEGDWFFYVTVNLRTGETKFAETYDEFLEHKAEFQEYCESSDAC